MADSRYSLPKATKKGAAEAEALNRQLLAVEADIQAGRLSDAAGSLNQLVAAHPKDGRLYVAGWLLANQAGNVEAAYLSAQRAVTLAPTSGTAFYCLSETERQLGDITAARESIEQAITHAPKNLQFQASAVNLALAQGDHAAAERSLRAAFQLDPNLSGIRTLLGNSLRAQNKLDEAKKCLLDAVALNADDADAHHGLAMIAHINNQRATSLEHVEHCLRLRPDDEQWVYLKAVFEGQTPATRPESMTRALFDPYATRFDADMVGALNYRVPQLIAQRVLAHFPERNINVLDLGCGTGLLGAALGPINGYFVGVDLSLPMMEEAKKHEVYSRLHNVNLLDALDATDANEYEVIVAADVFIYVGALDAAISGAFKVLKPGGWLFFSCESAPEDGPDFVLGKSMRYAQTTSYVKRLLDTSGFAASSIDAIDLRMEQQAVIAGFLVAAQKPA